MPKSSSARKKGSSRRRPKVKTTNCQPEIRPGAVGIDVGSTEMWVAVPADADPEPVRRFGVFTVDLEALAQWLVDLGMRTVAIESTGVYWIPLYGILADKGLEVCLVNARHVKNVPGRKTDVLDCQWLQYLHAVGLLRASYRPEAQICTLRALWRLRDRLVASAARQLQHMQKALLEMNLKLDNVLDDLSGKTGFLIIDAILAGERDPHKLAQHRDRRVKASTETIAKSLQGTWLLEHLLALRQARETWKHLQQQITECDGELQSLLARHESAPAAPEQPGQTPAAAPNAAAGVPAPLPTAKTRVTRGKTKGGMTESELQLREECARVLGTDLMLIPGIKIGVACTVLTELGPDLSAFPDEKHLSSWIGLCPDNRITGGKVLSSRTRKVKSRLANALRMAAQSLLRCKGYLGDFTRRMQAKLDSGAAITAVAHKLCRVIYYLIKHRCPFDMGVFAREEEASRQRQERQLKRLAARLGYELNPQTAPAMS